MSRAFGTRREGLGRMHSTMSILVFHHHLTTLFLIDRLLLVSKFLNIWKKKKTKKVARR